MKKSLLFLLPTLFLIASCGETKPDPVPPAHEHSFSTEWTSDKLNHWHVCSCGEKADLAAHVDNDSNLLCDICNAQLEPKHEHSFSTEWKYNATQHWHSCSCGERKDIADHVDADQNYICDICKLDLPKPHVDPCPDGQHVDLDQDMICDVCGYPIEYKHATSVSGDPAASFYLKVGEEKTLKATLSPSPEREVEKTFSWANSNSKLASLEVQKETNKAIIKGVAAGNAIFTATNDYNNTLKRNFYATVIDYDETNMSLWEYKSADRSQFGYEKDSAPAGTTSGVAQLGDISWSYTRSEANSLNVSKSGYIGFGKSAQPETSVELVANNSRKIKKIEIETCSAYELAHITMKIGETVVMDRATPSSTKDVIPALSTGVLEEALEGNISIKFDTPKVDETKLEDPEYDAPGAVYLKSIWITYEDVPFISDYTIDFVDMFNNPDSILSKNITSTTGKAFSFGENYYKISFDKIRKSDNKGNEYFEINSNINITLQKRDKVIKSIEFDWEIFDDSKNKFVIKSSQFGGDPFIYSSDESNTGSISLDIDNDYINAIRLNAGNTTYVGLKSITLKADDGEHCSIKDISYLEGAAPTKVDYVAGEVFDPAGLPDLLVAFENDAVDPVNVSNEFVNFYDGPSYETPADHSAASKKLLDGTTYVVAELNGFSTKIEGLTVKMQTIECTRVNSAEDLVSGNYLFVIPSTKQYWMGSSSSIKTADGVGLLDVEELTDTLTLPSTIEEDAFSIEKKEEIFNITVQDKKVGITAKGALSIASSPNDINWSITVTEGIADLSIGNAESLKHLIFATKFDVGDSSSNNIALYKISK